jgi:uncharacterized membrane protein
MQAVLEKIAQLTRSGYNYRAFDYLNRGIEYFRNHFGPIAILVGGSLLIPMVLDMVGLGGLSGLLSLLLITPFVQGAMALFLRKARAGAMPNVEDFGGAKEHLPNLILFNVIYALLIMALFIPVIIFLSSSGFFSVLMSSIDNPAGVVAFLSQMATGGALIVLLLVLIPIIYISIGYWWAPYLIVYLKLPAWQAMETSRKIITRQWFNHFGLAVILIGVAILLGFVTSIITRGGNLYLILQLIVSFLINSVMYCAIFAAYDDVVGTDESGEVEKRRTGSFDLLISRRFRFFSSRFEEDSYGFDLGVTHHFQAELIMA